MRILVIDDERANRRTIRTWLIQRGHDVHDAVGGPQAFQLLKTLPYDVVTLAAGLLYTNSLTIDDIRSISDGIHIVVLPTEASAFALLEHDLARLNGVPQENRLSPRIGFSNFITGEA